jgi:uncharacterized membrane protein YhaH (DUF805 family)
MSSSSSSGLIVLIVLLVVLLLYTVLNIVAVVKIITKAGYSGAWFLIMLVPIVGTIMFYVFAFSKWPVIKRLEAIQRSGQFSTGAGGPYGGPGGQYGGPQGPQGPPPPQGW